jgi:outer membrane protein TolC
MTAQKSLEDAQLRLIDAKYDSKISETELLKLSGKIIR